MEYIKIFIKKYKINKIIIKNKEIKNKFKDVFYFVSKMIKMKYS